MRGCAGARAAEGFSEFFGRRPLEAGMGGLQGPKRKVWLDTCLELVETSRRFGFGVGSRPPVSSRRSLSRSCLLLCFFDPCRPGGCNVWLGLARGFLLGGYQALNQLRRAEGLALGLARGPQFRDGLRRSGR